MAEVIEINDISALDPYRKAWHELLESTPNASFFHTLEWLECYWRHLAAGQKLRVLIVTSEDNILGIVPLVVRRERYRLATVRVLNYPLDNWGTWYGPITASPGATMLAAITHIRRAPRDWDMIDLRWCDSSGSSRDRSARAMRVAGLLTTKSPYQSTSLVDLDGDWEGYLAGKSHNQRRELRRLLRRASDRGVEYVRFRPHAAGGCDPRWDLYRDCEQIARQSWQSSTKFGNTLSHDGTSAFYRDAHLAACRLGMLDVNLLYADGQPAAFIYNYHFQGCVTGIRTGFDPEFDGLGSAVVVKTLEDGAGRGDQIFDFGPGEWEYKRRLRTREESTCRLTYAPVRSWRSQAVRITRWAKGRMGAGDAKPWKKGATA